MSLKPKQALFVASLVATGCPAVASRSDLKAAAEHGGWSCIPAWLRNDPARKVGRGQWNVADLLSGDAPVVSAPKAKSAPKPAPAPAPARSAASIPVAAAASMALAMTGGERETLVPDRIDTYVPFGHFDTVERVVASGMFYPMFITGLSGNGKTTMVDQVCAKLDRELFRVNITSATDEDDLLGGFRLINGETVWQDGPVVEAMKRGAVLLLDEIDLAGSAIMCLQPVLEGKGVFLKKIGQFIKPADGFTVVATANTKGQGDESGKFVATNILNEAFLDRFPVTLEQDYPAKSTEKRIVLKVMKSLGTEDKDFAGKLVDWSEGIRRCYAENAVDEIITTRRLVNIATAFSIFGDRRRSIEMAISRFDNATKEAFLSMYEKIDAGVRLDETPVADDAKDNSCPF
ncbi:MAG: AAA family ATPase [Candidatus Nanopelagicaceae bacterium]